MGTLPRFKTIHPISASLIACVGHNSESIELLKYDTNRLTLSKTISVPMMGSKEVVVHNGRGILLIESRICLQAFSLCDLSTGQGEVSRVPVPMAFGGPSSYVFSPDGLFVAYDTRNGIEICDLRNLASPVSVARIEIYSIFTPFCVAWLKEGLVVRKACDSDHAILSFNNSAAPFVARYAAYRKKLEEKEKETTKNAS